MAGISFYVYWNYIMIVSCLIWIIICVSLLIHHNWSRATVGTSDTPNTTEIPDTPDTTKIPDTPEKLLNTQETR